MNALTRTLRVIAGLMVISIVVSIIDPTGIIMMTWFIGYGVVSVAKLIKKVLS